MTCGLPSSIFNFRKTLSSASFKTRSSSWGRTWPTKTGRSSSRPRRQLERTKRFTSNSLQPNKRNNTCLRKYRV